MTLLAQANTGTGTDNLDTDQSVGTDHTTVAKIRTGGPGVNGGLVTPANPFPVSLGSTAVSITATALPLPAGAATEAALVAIDAEFGADGASPPAIPGTGVRGWLRSIYEKLNSGTLAISGAVSGTVAVNNFPATQPISATALPLPAGAATEATQLLSSTSALQVTGNNSLTSITNNTASTVTALGGTADAAASSDAGTFSLIALIKRLLGKLPATVGSKSPALSLAVTTTSLDTITGVASLAAINTDLLTNVVSGWLDVSQYRSWSLQLIGSVGITAGQVTIEHTNDTALAPAGTALPVSEINANTSTWLTGAQSITASTVRLFNGPLAARFIRVRASTAFLGGNIQAVACFSQTAHVPHLAAVTSIGVSIPVSFPIVPVLGALNGTSLSAFSNTAFITSAAITTTQTQAGQPGAAIATTGTGQLQTVSFGLTVSAVSGTSPTMDVVIQESFDNSATWEDVYHFPRVTAVLTKALQSPVLVLRGTSYRVVRTIGGTTPSFTTAMLQVQRSVNVPLFRQFFDRTIAPATIGSATPAWLVEGANTITAYVSSVSATTPATYQLQISLDATAWVNVGAATASTAASNVQFSVTDISAKWARVVVTAAGTAQVLSYVAVAAGGV